MRHLFKLDQIAAPIYEQKSFSTDLVAGIREDIVNEAIEKVHGAIYPALFKDQLNFPKANLCFQWDLKRSPYVNFANSKTAQADFIDFYKQAHEQLKESYPYHEYEENDFSEYSAPIAIELYIPELALKLFKIDKPDVSKSINLKITIACYFSINEYYELSINPYAGRIDNVKGIHDLVKELAPELKDSVNGTSEEDLIFLFINEVLFPFVLKACKDVIPKVEIPKLEFEGIVLEQYSISLQEKFLLIGTAVRTKSSEYSQPQLNLPNKEIYVSVSHNTFKKLNGKILEIASNALKEIVMRGKGYEDFRLDADLHSPELSIDDSWLTLRSWVTGGGCLRVNWWFWIFSIYGYVTSTGPIVVRFKPEFVGNDLVLKAVGRNEYFFGVALYSLNDLIAFLVTLALDLFPIILGLILTIVIDRVLSSIKVYTLPQLKFSVADLDITTDFVDPKIDMKNWSVDVGTNVRLQVKRNHKDRLLNGQQLKTGESLLSANGQYMLNYKDNGDIETINTANNALVWSAARWEFLCGGDHLILQEDGNLVAFSSEQKPYWATATNNELNKNNYVVQESDGNFVMYRSNGKPIWDSLGKYKESN